MGATPEVIAELVDELMTMSGVVAVVLGGSRALGTGDDESDWDLDASESGRRRKYYRITKEGRAQLAAQRQQWKAVDGTLRGIWMQACTV